MPLLHKLLFFSWKKSSIQEKCFGTSSPNKYQLWKAEKGKTNRARAMPLYIICCKLLMLCVVSYFYSLVFIHEIPNDNTEQLCSLPFISSLSVRKASGIHIGHLVLSLSISQPDPNICLLHTSMI